MAVPQWTANRGWTLTRVAGGVALLGVILSGPASIGAWAARPLTLARESVPAQPVMMLAQVERTTAGSASGAAVPEPQDASVAIATLFTNGPVEVVALDRRITVTNAVYPYLGGEELRVPDGSMAVLRVRADALVFMCGGVSARFTIGPRGPSLFLNTGTVRILSLAGQRFVVQAGTHRVVARVAGGESLFAVEMSRNGERLDVLPLSGAATSSATPEGMSAGDGLMWRLAGDGAQTLTFPASIPRPQLASGDLAAQISGGDYLCRTPELMRIASSGGVPGSGNDIALPPFLQAPGVPPLPLAEPDMALLFDPNTLPPPAAGPQQPLVVVPAPGLPISGSGGGDAATPE